MFFSVMWILKLLPKIGILGHFGPGLAGSFGALLVGWSVVVVRGPYFARHLHLLCILGIHQVEDKRWYYKSGLFGTRTVCFQKIVEVED